LHVALGFIPIERDKLGRGARQISKCIRDEATTQREIVPVDLGVCFFEQKHPHLMLARASEKGHVACSVTDGEVVIDRELLFKSTLPELKLVDTIFAIA